MGTKISILQHIPYAELIFFGHCTQLHCEYDWEQSVFIAGKLINLSLHLEY